MSNSDKDVITLNVYKLGLELALPQQQQQQQQSLQSSPQEQPHPYAGPIAFFSKILPQAGLGAYHTSIDVLGFCYTYGKSTGIIKTAVANKHSHIPDGVTFEQSIVLGKMNLSKGASSPLHVVNEVISALRRAFTGMNYDIMNRNCNHFSETLATSLIVAHGLSQDPPPLLETYPNWINRLARAGSGIIEFTNGVVDGVNATANAGARAGVGSCSGGQCVSDNESGNGSQSANTSSNPNLMLICNVIEEARVAAGVEVDTVWTIPPSNLKPHSKKVNPLLGMFHGGKLNCGGGGSSSSQKKKKLTENQKKALAMLKAKK